MDATKDSKVAAVRRKKRIVFVIAAALLIALFVLTLPPLQIISFFVWLIAALLVALVANVIFRVLDRQLRQ